MKTTIGFLLLLIIIMSSPLKAQQVKYNIVKDEPNYADMFLGLSGNMCVNTHTNIQQLNMGVDLYGKVLTRYRANLFFYTTLVGGTVVKSSIFGKGKYEYLKPYKVKELIGSFALTDVVKSRKTKIVLSQKEDNYIDPKYITTKFIKVPAEHRMILEARGGFVSYRDIYTGGEINNVAMGKIFDKSTGKPLAGNIYSRTVAVGIGYIDLKKVTVSAEGFGTYTTKGAQEYYFDFLVGSSLKFDAYKSTYDPNTFTFDNGVEENVDFDVENPSKMGWRLGLASYPGSTLGMTIRAEIGRFPGLSKMYYTNLSMGLSLTALLEKLYNPALRSPEK